jgi:hypothetical protein
MWDCALPREIPVSPTFQEKFRRRKEGFDENSRELHEGDGQFAEICAVAESVVTGYRNRDLAMLRQSIENLNMLLDHVTLCPSFDRDFVWCLTEIFHLNKELEIPGLMECISKLVSVSDSSESLVLETPLIEEVTSELLACPDNSELWQILAEICGFTCGGADLVMRILNGISLESMILLAPHDPSGSLPLILYNLTQIEPPPEESERILNFIAYCYQAGLESACKFNAWTLSQLIGKESFPIAPFYDLRLNFFLDDCLFDIDPKIRHAAVIAIGDLYKHHNPVCNSRFDGIWRLAFDPDEQCIAQAFQTMRFVSKKSDDFRKVFFPRKSGETSLVSISS